MTQVDLGLTSVGRFDSADLVISVNDVNEKPGASQLVDRLKEAPGHPTMYVKHLAKSIPNQVLYINSYFPKAPVDVVSGELAANCTDDQYKTLLEEMAPIAEQVAEKLNLQ
jgi:hypothetical protein